MTFSTHNGFKIQKALEHRILHGLAWEWKTALWVLPSEYRTSMQMPLFSIQDMKSRWGYWSGEKREICLSRDLIYHHSWEEIREVLRHEMAHQFADQVLGRTSQESSHGPIFQKACHLLRLDPKAFHGRVSVKGQVKNESSSPEVNMIRRVKKLMALAGSQNPNEAEAAMAKAHELIARYNIDLLAHAGHRNFTSKFAGRPALRHSRDVYHLANLLQNFYFVEGIWISAYVQDRGKMGRVLEISGTPYNVEIASYVYDFVQNYSHFQWQKYNKEKGLNHYRKTDFMVGVVEGFREKLESQYTKGEKEKDQLALIKAKDPLLKEYTIYKYPHTIFFKRTATHQDAWVMKDGVQAGKKLVIHKAIAEKEAYKNRLLEYKDKSS